ncbi:MULTISPECIES: very short patch repair endonuclease [Ralstonia]|nr:MULTISPECIES: very short patch repair endonuclease [Ralstonia]
MERTENMRRVRSADTRPEMVVRSTLHRLGYRFRLHDKRLPGSPDIVFRSRKIAIFVHGCFWHRHPGCSRATTPRTNTEFWQCKFNKNIARDTEVCTKLHALGWTTYVVWECELKSGSWIDPIVAALGPRALSNRATH